MLVFVFVFFQLIQINKLQVALIEKSWMYQNYGREDKKPNS